ncbi:MAG: response regulator [Candidatus Pseudobacter hemicellulosilyticus]|uniref:Response regulator n=1 Tax=Candidatus Pseudobacter hemicellulosilyticus TaxID=3121375 RepID=A0AAJ6BDB2_9BACT|nr:MAG: response regulator [Pseudobacter sp.]
MQKKILIIDDEPDLCLLLKAYFSKKDYEVHVRHTLREGVSEMQALQPDILFLDNNLPDGIGWMQVESFIKHNPGLRLYLMSGFQPSFQDIPGINYRVLTKPISFADFAEL